MSSTHLARRNGQKIGGRKTAALNIFEDISFKRIEDMS